MSAVPHTLVNSGYLYCGLFSPYMCLLCVTIAGVLRLAMVLGPFYLDVGTVNISIDVLACLFLTVYVLACMPRVFSFRAWKVFSPGF